MTNITTIILGDSLTDIFPEKIRILAGEEEKTFYLSYVAHMEDSDSPPRLMIEYRDMNEEMKELINYEKRYGK